MNDRKATYGGRPCTVSNQVYKYGARKGEVDPDYFFVVLDKDPGYGSMYVSNVHRSQLVFTA